MIRNIVIGVLAIGVIGLSVFAYNSNKEKENFLTSVENNYQRAFHELTYHMDLLHDHIGTSLAMNSKDSLSPQFVEIWKVTSEAKGNVSQLPLDLVPVHDTEQFLHDVGNFTYETSIRDLDDEPLNKEEIQTLEDLYEQSAEVKDNLRKMQHVTLNDGLKWVEIDQLLADGSEEEHEIIDGFKEVDGHITKFSEQNNPLLQTAKNEDNKYGLLKEKKESEESIEKKVRHLFSIEEDQPLTVTKSEQDAPIQTYSFTSELDDLYMYVEMTENGGYPLSLLIDRDVNEATVSLYDGQIKAEKFLEDFDFETMDLYETQQFQNIGLYKFVHVQNDVRIFPDTVSVKVALDDGEIIGLQAYDYVRNHHNRNIEKPKLSKKEAEKEIHENIQIEEDNLAIVENDRGDEILAYEFIGTMNNETYRVFINAESGAEEKIEKLSNKDMNFDMMG